MSVSVWGRVAVGSGCTDSRARPRVRRELLVLWALLCPSYLRRHRIFPSSRVPGALGVKVSSRPLALAGWPGARDPDGRDDRGGSPCLPLFLTAAAHEQVPAPSPRVHEPLLGGAGPSLGFRG